MTPSDLTPHPTAECARTGLHHCGHIPSELIHCEDNREKHGISSFSGHAERRSLFVIQQRQQGIAIVEFTIVLPFLLFLFLSLCEIGRAIYTYTEIEKVSRDSARYLSGEIIKGTSGNYALTTENIVYAKNLAVYGSINGGSNPVIDNLQASHVNISLVDNYIKVEIAYPYQPVIGDIPALVGGDAINMHFKLVSSYSMRVL